MNKKLIINILRFVVCLFLQVSICNYIHLFGLFTPNIYLFALLLLPLTIAEPIQYLIAFASGVVVDVFSMTFGVHAAAALLLIFLRPTILKKMAVGKVPKEGLEVPVPGQKSFQWLALYTFIVVLIHQFAVTMFEVFSFSRFYWTLLVVLGNTLLTTLLVLALQYLFTPSVKK